MNDLRKTKTKKIQRKIQKSNETGDSRYIYQNELEKRTASDKAFNITKNPKCDGYQ